MEMLSIAKGCDMCSEELTINELTRHLTAADTQVRLTYSTYVLMYSLTHSPTH